MRELQRHVVPRVRLQQELGLLAVGRVHHLPRQLIDVEHPRAQRHRRAVLQVEERLEHQQVTVPLVVDDVRREARDVVRRAGDRQRHLLDGGADVVEPEERRLRPAVDAELEEPPARERGQLRCRRRRRRRRPRLLLIQIQIVRIIVVIILLILTKINLMTVKVN